VSKEIENFRKRVSSWEPFFQSAAKEYKVDPDALKAMMFVESRGNPQAQAQTTPWVTVPGERATGPMQFLPSTFKGLGFDLGKITDPETAIKAGAKYLKQGLDRHGGDLSKAVMFYHGGPDTKRWGEKTQAHAQRVENAYNSLAGKSALGNAISPKAIAQGAKDLARRGAASVDDALKIIFDTVNGQTMQAMQSQGQPPERPALPPSPPEPTIYDKLAAMQQPEQSNPLMGQTMAQPAPAQASQQSPLLSPQVQSLPELPPVSFAGPDSPRPFGGNPLFTRR
jgi:hypothetical protein